jgi:DNA sulfur modification protein DndD
VRKYYAEMVSKTTDDTEISILDVDGHYKLSVKSEHKNEKIGSLSAGEKQVLALAMTAAMYRICKIDAPVLIDTPMGRISGDARDNITNYLPHYLEDTQLIFLPTDTEYTSNVREKLLPYVGKEYRIKYDDEKKESEVIDYE